MATPSTLPKAPPRHAPARAARPPQFTFIGPPVYRAVVLIDGRGTVTVITTLDDVAHALDVTDDDLRDQLFNIAKTVGLPANVDDGEAGLAFCTVAYAIVQEQRRRSEVTPP